MAYNTKMRQTVVTFLFLIFVGLSHSGQAMAQDSAAQSAPAIQHTVLPGDTWDSLTWRYGLSAEDLAPYRTINQVRQPVIGSVLLLPDRGINRAGVMLRSEAGGLLATAVTHHTTPWAIALQNGLTHPYLPLNYQPLFLPGTDAPRDLPVGFSDLQLSAIPARPGQALALRGVTAQPLTTTVKLNLQAFNSFGNDRTQVALGGTYNFYGSGQPELSIQPANAPGWSQPWQFIDDQWDFEQITLTGTAAQITQEDIDKERARLFEIWNMATPDVQWNAPFREPLDSYLFISSNYGARRSYNGGPYNRSHEGVDFAAYGGTPVLASASGTVVVAETLYVRGGTVIIDHGLGVYTGVYHMSSVLVNVGDVVQTGQIVGEVGSTGFSTGNHLHWDLLVNGTWVNAQAWTEQNLACWIAEGWGRPCEP
ncbi:MAG: M23 family metallopeptidase [Ardenticatenaceae bacterium]|nr:M23 family metallopeptidase [Ardenticatenaceae bacterium]MCB8989427.1 M23 family metallopeptidase [Ardenticatenaceae bacterium]MCB9005035.1 M23 family metallopeptidase [Ardenticatenaceae bacterium]